ncbi:aldo/keto reductase [Pseudomonas chlororaphis]|uniref:aldo/keto reductase n=1 Tax=Pseudomonas chlororaphis TaxID=587753 RepID=UPI0023660509|nr:aldo/keto reductase [Pseudomonas chlororaphis]WDH24905.1 aldo/keto reductase [Pseudomonas chlororaphis]
MIDFSTNDKTLVLGTALWGWGIDRNAAHQLLDNFLNNDGSIVDTATNYPINKQGKDFGLAISWIESWVKSNPNSNLSVIVKIGSIDNSGNPDADLNPNKITSTTNDLKDRLGEALSCVSVHWDNRGNDEHDLNSIEKTLNAMSEIQQSGLRIGLSGIKHPELYYKANPELSDSWIIQIKENFTTQKARENYYKYFPNAKYLAYGINLGGVKIDPTEKNSSVELRNIAHPKTLVEKLSKFLDSNHQLTPRPTTLNELALAFSYANPVLSGVIIGPRNITQLLNTLEYWNALKSTFTPTNKLELLSALAEQTENR